MKIKSKSLIIGILLGVVIMFVVGAAGTYREGRYQLGGGSDRSYVLDTKTGEVWERGHAGPEYGYSIYLGTNEKPAFEMIVSDN